MSWMNIFRLHAISFWQKLQNILYIYSTWKPNLSCCFSRSILKTESLTNKQYVWYMWYLQPSHRRTFYSLQTSKPQKLSPTKLLQFPASVLLVGCLHYHHPLTWIGLLISFLSGTAPLPGDKCTGWVHPEPPTSCLEAFIDTPGEARGKETVWQKTHSLPITLRRLTCFP